VIAVILACEALDLKQRQTISGPTSTFCPSYGWRWRGCTSCYEGCQAVSFNISYCYTLWVSFSALFPRPRCKIYNLNLISFHTVVKF